MPADSEQTWASTGQTPLGLQPDAVPDDVTLESTRVGRVIQQFGPNKRGKYTYIALYPACGKNTFVPPCPGVVPQGIRDPSNPVSCFSDGTLGRWDPRKYPLLYESRRPWLGFHKGPFIMPLTQPREPFVQDVFGNYSRIYDPRHEHPEYLPTTEYYRWNAPGAPWKGGTWDRNMISRLFCVRRNAEASALEQLREYERVSRVPLDLSDFERPYRDELEWEDTLVWVSWAEGRDALARTSRYTAELFALGNWLAQKRKCLTDHPGEAQARPDLFMGVWAMTISTRAEWDELRYAGVPIYIAHEIPPESPLVAGAQIGDYDADERYRQNAYNSTHGMPGRQTRRSYNFGPQSVQGSTRPHNFPHQLSTPPPVHHITDNTSASTSWNKPWTSYLHMDTSILRPFNSKLIRLGTNESLATFHRESLLLAPFLPPGRRVLTVEEEPHPFFTVCSTARGNGTRHYLEIYDEQSASWWFQSVKRHSIQKVESSTYCFNYPGESTVIYSDHEFPGQHPLYCRISRKPPTSILPSVRSRRYFWKCPQLGENPKYTWEYTSHYDYSSAAVDEMDDTGPATEEDPVNNDVMVDVDWELHDQPLTWSGRLQLLLEQRRHLELEVDRRIFGPVKWQLQSDAIVRWTVPGTIEGMVWPVRIANVHGEAEYQSVVNMLVNACQIRAVDILLICPYAEVDATLTVDVGLRYCEDVLWLWSLLHGVMVDERCLEVYPLLALKGRTYIHDIGDFQEREAGTRLARWDAVLHCDDTAPPSSSFSKHMDDFPLYAGQSESDEEIANGAEHREAIICRIPSLLGVQVNAIRLECQPVAFDGCIEPPACEPNLYAAMRGSFRWKEASRMIGHAQQSSGSSTATHTSSEVSSKPYARPQRGSETVSSKKKPNRRSKPRKGRLVQDGKEGSRMTNGQRRNVCSIFKNKGHRILESCKFILPFYTLDNTEGDLDSDAMIKVVSSWWDWADECRHLLDSERNKLMMQGKAQDYDWSIVEQVFGHLAKFQCFYGEERELCMDALRKRPPWIPQMEPNAIQYSYDML